MEFLRAQWSQIGRQVACMNASQRIAVALLVVVLLGGMYGLVAWSGQPEWMPLLDQAFSLEQIQKVQGELASAGVATRVAGDRVMIRGNDEERRRLTAVLAQRGALPRDTSLGYSALVQQSSVFMGDRSRMWMEHRGLETELSGVLSRFAGISDAHVFIEVPQQRGLRGESSASRASVHVTLAGGESLDKQRVAAIANFVVGAVSGLEVRNVKITDGLRYYRPPGTGENLSTEILDLQRQAEEHHAQKVYDQLRFIPGVLVAVHASMADADQQIQERTLGPAVTDSETSRTEETNSASASAAPGVRVNPGRGLADASPGSTSSKKETETSLKGERDVKTTSTVKRAGLVERLTASVNVPRSYLERIVERQGSSSSKDAKAGEAAFEKVAQAELAKIRASVKPLVNATSDEQVVVNWYYDMPVEAQPAERSQTAGITALAKDHGPQAALGLLAVACLFWVMRIVRRAQGSAVSAGRGVAGRTAGRSMPVSVVGGEGALQPLGGGPVTVGEAEEVEGVMMDHEVDERHARTQHIVRQIGQMVREDVTPAANVLKQWLQQGS
jgi:flagellar biosynthesis/type III secretory pathway M-ring protein FliF/YscJ